MHLQIHTHLLPSLWEKNVIIRSVNLKLIVCETSSWKTLLFPVITALFEKSSSYLKRVQKGSIQPLVPAEWDEIWLVNKCMTGEFEGWYWCSFLNTQQGFFAIRRTGIRLKSSWYSIICLWFLVLTQTSSGSMDKFMDQTLPQ